MNDHEKWLAMPSSELNKIIDLFQEVHYLLDGEDTLSDEDRKELSKKSLKAWMRLQELEHTAVDVFGV